MHVSQGLVGLIWLETIMEYNAALGVLCHRNYSCTRPGRAISAILITPCVMVL